MRKVRPCVWLLGALGLWIQPALARDILFPASGRRTYQEESQKAFPSAAIHEIRVENARGRIELLADPGSQVTVIARKVARGRSLADARSLAASTSVEVARLEGRLDIKVVYPVVTQTWSFWSDWDRRPRRVEVRLRILVPGKTGVEARVASGDIVSRGLAGRQHLMATSGDLHVDQASGRVEIRTTSGDLLAREIEGESVIQTVSGDVRVSALKGTSSIHTTSGDIRLSDASGFVDLSTVSGDATVRGAGGGLHFSTTSGDLIARQVSGECQVSASSGDADVHLADKLQGADLSTASGDVMVRLGPEVGGDLELRTGSGTIDVSCPVSIKSVSRHLVSGRVPGGNAPIRVRTSSGEVSVQRAVEAP